MSVTFINPFLLTPSDPSFASVVSLLHLNGSDASTTFTDVKGKTWSAAGNAQLDTAQSKFGTASLLLDGSGDYITSADSADWTFGTGDFTIECFWRPNASASHTLFSHRSSAANGWCLIADMSVGTGLRFVQFVGDSPNINCQQGATTGWSTGTWYHVCAERSGNTFRVYRDGVVLASATDSDSVADVAGALQIGSGALNGTGQQDANGWLDEIRITKGVARYNGAFTPPAAPFPDN